MHHFFSLLLAITGLHVSVWFAGINSERTIVRHYISRLTVPNGMLWGSWGYKDMCPNGTYANGFSLKVERLSYGLQNDNTALNGIRLHCVYLCMCTLGINDDYDTVESDVGRWGEWTKIKWCPSGFLTAFQLRVESFRGFEDDTAANNIRFKCSDGATLQGDGTYFGDWGDWSQTCGGMGICGIKTRVEGPQGTGDDTALNDVVMYCCN